MMTKTRAERAAMILDERGWEMDGESARHCQRCRVTVKPGDNYCAQCGAKIPTTYSDVILADLEAAIAAAVD